MTLEGTFGKRALYEGLTRYNYFPNQKKTVGEIPPSINTRQFTPEVAEEICAQAEKRDRRSSAYDLALYRATRYNNIPRILSLVHPAPYSRLCKHIHDNWEHINYICTNESSQAKPSAHQDGRLMVMNYGDPIESKISHHRSAFGKKFLVKADISNCFGSIYSHAIPWAAVGITTAKADTSNSLWYNGLDLYQRRCKRKETHGVPVGPVTSNIVVEIILDSVDRKLNSLGFEFERYIDDYTIHCTSNDQAHEFVNELNKSLSELKLTLNLEKTKIEELPTSTEELWILELLSKIPKNSHNELYTESAAINLINQAIYINKKTPDGSILKYAFQLLSQKIGNVTAYRLLPIIFDLSWHYPVLTPYIEQFISISNVDPGVFDKKIFELVSHNSKLSRSDGMSWPLHILLKHGIKIPEDLTKKVVESKDCVSITIAQELAPEDKHIMSFSNEILRSDNYTKDNYWPLIYQYFLKARIRNPYDDDTFPIMKYFGVNFFPGDHKSKSEQLSDTANTKLIAEAFNHSE